MPEYAEGGGGVKRLGTYTHVQLMEPQGLDYNVYYILTYWNHFVLVIVQLYLFEFLRC